MNTTNAIIIIPARYASTRFPGKPLALLDGKPMIQHVVEQAKKLGLRTVVATDDERIEHAVRSFSSEVVMTSSEHRSGTDRIIEAYRKVNHGEQIVLNLQGDEPFILPQQIVSLISAFELPSTDIATLAEAYAPTTTDSMLSDPNSVKLVRNSEGRALYFSRSIIPHLRGVQSNLCRHHTYYKHIGLYAFRAEVLLHLASLSQSTLEIAENLEQLRWLEAGYDIQVMLTERATIGIDTPEDLIRAEAYLRELNK